MGRAVIALLILTITFAVGNEKSIAAESGIVLSDIYEQRDLLSPSQQHAYRQYWASTFRDRPWELPDYLDDAALIDLQSGIMPMTDDGVVVLHWSRSQKGGHYVAVFDTNALNAPTIPIFSTNSGTFFELVQLKKVAPGMYLGKYDPGQEAYVRVAFGAIYIDADAGAAAKGRPRPHKQSWKVVNRWE